ncbi:prophage tail protein [Shigella sonnei]|uniref:Prophage tail protein n=2 Tax=Shigella sonnei TaxID=624 RepID=A0ABC9KR61_SHISO|nr:prophage tail protein [Shigella sonnei]CSN92857.1 prophage tail protein [Shigella sonnei]CSO27978.1 prophage tail protein [Shigella sonnei]CSP11800.1 prophage tail protein [Shigella sonnei]CSP37551.1 prophage tail protein [Shigella sonnei]
MSLAQCPGFLFAHREECTVEIKKIINPRYTESGAVDCDVFFDDRDQAVPYTATADDVAPTGQRIWQELQSGKWGEIAPFTVTPEMLEAAREARRQEIEAWRTEQEAKPFTFEWNGRIWNAGPNSLGRLSPVVMLAKSVTAQTDADNQQVKLSMPELEELAAAMVQAQVDRNDEIYRRQREMKEELSGLEDLGTIRAFDVT